MIKKIMFAGEQYPEYEAKGNAAQYIISMAKNYCKGDGYDIGAGKEKWALPGAEIIDIKINKHNSLFSVDYNANRLPNRHVDYIFSSHCLEHVDNWIDTMDYWYIALKPGGVLFLYLPHISQKYWRPWSDKRHKHLLTEEIIVAYMEDKGYKEIKTAGCDLMHSFTVIGVK